jgi:hypothetical protein
METWPEAERYGGALESALRSAAQERHFGFDDPL